VTTATKPQRRLRRRRRVRAKVQGTAARPRISIFRSNRGIMAQLVDDVAARTLASVHWHEDALEPVAGIDRSRRAGGLLAERSKAAGVQDAVFDRGGYRYHGHVKAFADGAREGGLVF
jgi:large subunit ribosomal protein L18